MTAYNFDDVLLVGFPHTDLRDISKMPGFVIYDPDDLDILVAKGAKQHSDTTGKKQTNDIAAKNDPVEA